MARRKKHNITHVASSVSEERKYSDWILMRKRMEAAKRLKPGWHTFYEVKNGPGYAVAIKRKLTAHYPYLAHFVDKNGLGRSYTYAELENMIIKPELPIITEAEEKKEESG